jgi:hypothetical protein
VTGAIVSRERELDGISEFLELVPGGAEILLNDGEAGIRKTTLWQAAVAAARDRSWRVLESRPVESEAKLSFAATAPLPASTRPCSSMPESP